MVYFLCVYHMAWLVESHVEGAVSAAVKFLIILERFSKCQEKVVSELIYFYFQCFVADVFIYSVPSR